MLPGAPSKENGISPHATRSGKLVSVPSSPSLLEAVGLRKSYGSRLVLDGISLAVNAGEVVGLLGPNGAGKTTTLSLLATLIEPDSGTVRIAGAVPSLRHRALRKRIGFVPQAIALYPSLSGLHNLELFARLHGLSKSDAQSESMRALGEVGLTDRADDSVMTLSGGMQRRLNLACGLVHRPDLLLLDEPTVGVDPQSREQILETIRRAAARGAAVVYSTHYMEEVERICSRALLIDRGTVVASGTINELIALGGRQPLMELTFQEAAPPAWCDGLHGITQIKLPGANGNGKVALQLESFALINPILECARAAGAQIIEFNVHTPNLSDAFIALTGRALRDLPPGSH
jgi:ABC-2 type transport system ATP-binding protein